MLCTAVHYTDCWLAGGGLTLGLRFVIMENASGLQLFQAKLKV